MLRLATAFGLGLALTSLSACGDNEAGNAENGSAAQTEEAKDAAGSKTIAAGIGQNSQFALLAKSAGLDQTLAGPGPYTVFVPDDAAFGKLPAGTTQNWAKPEQRSGVTRALTTHIVPGVVLAEDIGKAIDKGKGKTALMTTGGETLTATRDGDKIVLTDANGGRAAVVRADEKYSNGVVHQIDAVLAPSKS
jgi:uncharacterized surface protein with fasciclin (FAS1) repeats